MSETMTLDYDWKSARDCLASVRKSHPESSRDAHQQILLNFAAKGMIVGRCATGTIGTTLGYLAPNETWETPHIDNVSGLIIQGEIWEIIAKSRPECMSVDFTTGTAKGFRETEDEGELKRITVNLGEIEFDGTALDQALSIRPSITQEPMSATEGTSKGGRNNAKHGRPIATLTIHLLNLSDAEFARCKAEALVAELAEAYKQVGAAPPAGKNMVGICQGILRTVRDVRS